MENKESKYVKILREICREEGISLSAYSSDWAFRLKKNGRTAFILGYQFGLNASSVQQVCRDKNITSEVLREDAVPSVYHACFMTPALQGWIGAHGNWRELLGLLDRYKALVCKDNYGTGGNQVYLVRSELELEHAAAEIFRVSEAMAVCPYEEIEEECRLVLLDGEIRLAFRKIRQAVTGDGIRSFGELIGEAAAKGAAGGYQLPRAGELKRVPAAGEKILLNWKHNLGQGAVSEELSIENLPREMKELAARVSQSLQIRFASVDMIRSSKKAEDYQGFEECQSAWKVLEVNSGVMMEHFASESEAHYRKAKEIYRDAILRML